MLALFLVLAGGTAYAVDGPNPGQNTVGSEDIIGNEIKSDDIGNGRIFNLDIADEVITGAKLKNGTVTGADVDESSLNFATFSGASQVTDTDGCFDHDGTGTVCAQTVVSLHEPSRLRAEHTGEWLTWWFDDYLGANKDNDDGHSIGRANGSCRIVIEEEESVVASSVPRAMGEANPSPTGFPVHYEADHGPGTWSGQLLTSFLPAGTYVVKSICTETDGLIGWQNIVLDVFAAGNTR